MAITKIKPVKSTLNKALSYICNPDKTDGKILISSYGCAYETADIEFEFTLSQGIEKGNNLAHHLIQSFEPGEVDYEEAHKIGKKLADEVTKGQYEYVLTTHIDKGHVHNHILFCAVNFIDHRKYVSNKKSYYGIRKISDHLCREAGLSVITQEKEKGKSYKEYTATKDGTSWKARLKNKVDQLIIKAVDFEDLLRLLEKSGYEIKRGKFISCRASGRERFTRLKTLGENYTEEALKERIGKGISHFKKEKKSEKHGINLLIDIENSIKAQQSKGYANWAKKFNLKQAAETLNFLTEHHLLSYEALETELNELTLKSETVRTTLISIEKRLLEVGFILKNLSVYQQTKGVNKMFLLTGNKEEFKRLNERELKLYGSSVKALKKTKIDPEKKNVKTIRNEYQKLMEEKEMIEREYANVKKSLREFENIKANTYKLINAKEKKGKIRSQSL